MKISRLAPLVFVLAIAATACSSSESDDAATSTLDETSETTGAATDDTTPAGEQDTASTDSDDTASGNDEDAASESGVEGSWALSALNIDGVDIDVPGGLGVVVEDGTITGSTGCNGFSGTLNADSNGAGVVIEDFTAETEECGDADAKEFEDDYLSVLESVMSVDAGSGGMNLAGPEVAASYTRI